MDFFQSRKRDKWASRGLLLTKDIVCIREETNAGHHDGTDVIPAKGRLVDLGEGESSTLIGVGNVGEIIVEVVERGVTARGLVVARHVWSQGVPGKDKVARQERRAPSCTRALMRSCRVPGGNKKGKGEEGLWRV